MSAPSLIVQTPGEPVAATAPSTSTTTQPALYVAKHNGGGRWRIYSTAIDDWFSDFVVTGEGAKDLAEAEAERLNAGGEPHAKPEEEAPAAQASNPAPSTSAVDATTLKQAVMTREGWLCPETPAAKG